MDAKKISGNARHAGRGSDDAPVRRAKRFSVVGARAVCSLRMLECRVAGIRQNSAQHVARNSWSPLPHNRLYSKPDSAVARKLDRVAAVESVYGSDSDSVWDFTSDSVSRCAAKERTSASEMDGDGVGLRSAAGLDFKIYSRPRVLVVQSPNCSMNCSMNHANICFPILRIGHTMPVRTARRSGNFGIQSANGGKN